MMMKEDVSLDGKSILIMGGQPATVRATACLLAANGALVFISGDDEPTLAGHLNYIRQKVPGCSVIGTAANVSSTAGICYSHAFRYAIFTGFVRQRSNEHMSMIRFGKYLGLSFQSGMADPFQSVSNCRNHMDAKASGI
jgi:NAD(P)-dependent dehydrogenase (short-subunit alcohol dehydrogenase family)